MSRFALPSMRSASVVGSVLACLLTFSACGADNPPDQPTVFAAASLHESFEELAADNGADVTFSFDGSSGLVDQIAEGAPADVFASADTANMDRAVDEGLIQGEPVRFATNTLVMVVPDGNPAAVVGLDESLNGAKLVICAAEVPCGRASLALAESVGVVLDPVSEESNVTDVLGKVTSGEADAGLVYATDAMSAGDDVEVIEIPGSADHVNEYWIGVVTDGDHEAAAGFIDLVTSQPGQDLLATYGFGPA